MDIEISQDEFFRLATRIDAEIVLPLLLFIPGDIPDINFVPERKLQKGVIFAAHTDQRQVKVSSASIPIMKRSGSRVSIRTNTTTFVCTHFQREDWTYPWRQDTSQDLVAISTFRLPGLEPTEVSALSFAMVRSIVAYLTGSRKLVPH